MSDYSLAIDEIERSWGIIDKDRRIEYFENHFRDWIDSMPPELKSEILGLMNSFSYYTKSQVCNFLKQIHQDYVSKNVDFDFAFIMPVPSNYGMINSTTEYQLEYRLTNEISKNNCPNGWEEKTVKSALKHIKTIIIVDDFCGSGDTIIRCLSQHKRVVKKKKILIIVIHIMDAAVRRLNEYSVKNKLDLEIKSFNRSDAIINSLNPKQQEIITNGCRVLKIKKCIWGYKDTGALVAFYENTPNNTMGIFWQSKRLTNAIFPRTEDSMITAVELAKKKRERKRRNLWYKIKTFLN